MKTVVQFADMDKAERNKMSENGRDFYLEHLSLDSGVDAFSKLFMVMSDVGF